MGWDTIVNEQPCWCGKGLIRVTRQSHDSFSYEKAERAEILCATCRKTREWSARARMKDGMWEGGFVRRVDATE